MNIAPSQPPVEDIDAYRWNVISRRDKSSAHQFVYAVRTTKIYCRPSCHSRLARRANVLFFDTPLDASRAGYRPCKRCKPDTVIDEASCVQARVVESALRIIEREKGKVKMFQIAGEVGLSTRYFSGLFLRVTGVTPGQYAKDFRKGCISDPATGVTENGVTSKQQENDQEQAFMQQQPDDFSMDFDPLPGLDEIDWLMLGLSNHAPESTLSLNFDLDPQIV